MHIALDGVKQMTFLIELREKECNTDKFCHAQPQQQLPSSVPFSGATASVLSNLHLHITSLTTRLTTMCAAHLPLLASCARQHQHAGADISISPCDCALSLRIDDIHYLRSFSWSYEYGSKHWMKTYS